jgi:hypothetical protein
MRHTSRFRCSQGGCHPERLGVLIVAENASTRQGGESILALRWFLELLKIGVDVHLLVHVRSKYELDRSLGRLASRIHYVPDLLVQRICWSLGEALPAHVRSFTSEWLVHLFTQIMQRRAARQLIKKYKIEIVHEPAPVAPRLPNMMYGLGVPVLIGKRQHDLSPGIPRPVIPGANVRAGGEKLWGPGQLSHSRKAARGDAAGG